MKYLPVFLLIGGAVLVSLIGFIIFNLRSKEAPGLSSNKEERVVKELSFEERPYVTLTPNSAGNELSLSITRIPTSIETIEYELTYNTAAGVLQGVPGSVDVAGKSVLERELTLGTCSSGVCRYDKGVKDIKLSLKLRDGKGKLLAKTPAMAVNLLNNTQNLTNGKFSLRLDKKTKDYYVVMETYGVPGKIPGKVIEGPYGVFTSGKNKQIGTVDFAIVHQWDGNSWEEVRGGKISSLGVFTVLSE